MKQAPKRTTRHIVSMLCDTGCCHRSSVNTSSRHPSRIIFPLKRSLFHQIRIRRPTPTANQSSLFLHLNTLSASSPPLAVVRGSQSKADASKPCFTVTRYISQDAEPRFLAELPRRDFYNYRSGSDKVDLFRSASLQLPPRLLIPPKANTL